MGEVMSVEMSEEVEIMAAQYNAGQFRTLDFQGRQFCLSFGVSGYFNNEAMLYRVDYFAPMTDGDLAADCLSVSIQYQREHDLYRIQAEVVSAATLATDTLFNYSQMGCDDLLRVPEFIRGVEADRARRAAMASAATSGESAPGLETGVVAIPEPATGLTTTPLQGVPIGLPSEAEGA